MKSYPNNRFSKSQQGAVLIESMIALVIFSLGVLALAGLQAAMIKNTDEAKYRAEAAFIAQDQISEIWTSGNPTLATHIITDEEIDQLPQGKISVAIAAGNVVDVTVNWTLPGGTEHTYFTRARVEF